MTSEYRNSAGDSWRAGNRLLIASALLCTTFITVAAEIDNIRFHGSLIKRTCQLDTGSEDFDVSLGSIVDRYLYANERTAGKVLEIRLKNCNTSTKKGVRATFSGKESDDLPGLLALSGGQASGAAIGLETADGSAILFNQVGSLQALTGGDNVLTLKAYVKGEPKALSSRSLVVGDFSVTATFTLQYE